MATGVSSISGMIGDKRSLVDGVDEAKTVDTELHCCGLASVLTVEVLVVHWSSSLGAVSADKLDSAEGSAR